MKNSPIWGYFAVFEKLGFVRFGEFRKRGFAAGSGIFLQKALLDGLIVLGLDFRHSLGGRGSLESLKRSFDVFFDLLVVRSALFCLTGSFFRRFDNRH